MKICNMHYIFPCMSKFLLEKVDMFLKTQLLQKKRSRNWRLINSCLKYYTQYAKIVEIWLSAGNIQIVRNGRQLFEFLVGLRPEKNVSELLKSMSSKEKFLEEPLILFCESIFTLLQVHGGEKVFQVSEKVQNQGIDWDQEIEDETQILQRLENNMGKLE